jgi:hypothetical protein
VFLAIRRLDLTAPSSLKFFIFKVDDLALNLPFLPVKAFFSRILMEIVVLNETKLRPKKPFPRRSGKNPLKCRGANVCKTSPEYRILAPPNACTAFYNIKSGRWLLFGQSTVQIEPLLSPPKLHCPPVKL